MEDVISIKPKFVMTIALTGGPCGGKSTIATVICTMLRQKGLPTFVVKEVASRMVENGFRFEFGHSRERNIFLQSCVYQQQEDAELAAVAAASSCGSPAVVLIDRGLPDVGAYLDESSWQELLTRQDTSVPRLYERYDMACFLKSCAGELPAKYSRNRFRKNSVDEAATLCQLTHRVWADHPRLQVIHEQSDFNEKVARTSSMVSQAVDAWLQQIHSMAPSCSAPQSPIQLSP